MRIIQTSILIMLSTAALLLSSGCSLALLHREGEPPPRLDAEIPEGLPSIDYEITVRYFTQDEVGITQSVEEIAAKVTEFPAPEGGSYYLWTDCLVRNFALAPEDDPVENGLEFDRITGDDSALWQPLEEGIGFSYYVEGTIADEIGQLGNLPDFGFLRRDMDGFHYYLNLIDFHMWDLYADMINDPENQTPLQEKGDTFLSIQEGHVIDLAEWDNITTDLEMEGGLIFIEYVGDSEYEGEATRIFYFRQNQRIRQEVYGSLIGDLAFKMPLRGTNRFLGIFELDRENRLVRAHFNEYVYSRVHAPFFIKVLVHHKREFFVQRTKNE